MAEEQKVIYWPVVQLLDRGWSEELIARLLPPPAHRRCGRSQNRRRCWPKDTVLEAEHTREFQTGRQPRPEKKRLEPADIQSALALAAEALEQAWQTPDAPETRRDRPPPRKSRRNRRPPFRSQRRSLPPKPLLRKPPRKLRRNRPPPLLELRKPLPQPRPPASVRS